VQLLAENIRRLLLLLPVLTGGKHTRLLGSVQVHCAEGIVLRLLSTKHVRLIFRIRVALMEIKLHVFFGERAENRLCELHVRRLVLLQVRVEVWEVEWRWLPTSTAALAW